MRQLSYKLDVSDDATATASSTARSSTPPSRVWTRKPMRRRPPPRRLPRRPRSPRRSSVDNPRKQSAKRPNAMPRTNNKHRSPHCSSRHRRNPRRRDRARRPWSGPPSGPMGTCSRASKRATCGPWIHTPATPALTATHTSKACARPLSSAVAPQRRNCPAEQPGSFISTSSYRLVETCPGRDSDGASTPVNPH